MDADKVHLVAFVLLLFGLGLGTGLGVAALLTWSVACAAGAVASFAIAGVAGFVCCLLSL